MPANDPRPLMCCRKTRILLVAGVARGLRMMHKKRVVHGDLNAGNVLVTRDWTAKVTLPPVLRAWLLPLPLSLPPPVPVFGLSVIGPVFYSFVRV